MTKPEHDCGEACAELNEKQHRFHLLILAGKTQRAAHKEAGYEAKDRDAAASTLASNCKFQAAMRHHREVEAIRYSKTKQASTDRLVARASGSKAEHFFSVGADGEVDIRGWADLDGELTRAVGAVELHPDGSLKKLTVRDGVAAERALAELHGWKAPTRVDVSSADERWRELTAAAGDGDQAALTAMGEVDAGADDFEVKVLAAWRSWKEGGG